ncbi:MAG: glycosyltransferase, partial [Actinomycetota bacterium]|nr:glycosyltransferase [Actinomycetota bacterium]
FADPPLASGIHSSPITRPSMSCPWSIGLNLSTTSQCRCSRACPTKTLEYLAAGLPVVSTRVPDVVSSFSEVVALRDDAAGFAAGCREVLGHSLQERDARMAPLMEERRWDTIAARMQGLMDRELATDYSRLGDGVDLTFDATDERVL